MRIRLRATMIAYLSKSRAILIPAVVMLIGAVVLLSSLHATGSIVATEAEAGTLTSCANQITDTSASAGSAVQFAQCSGSTNPSATAGASLPISYNLSSLTGTVIYVSPSGSDTGTGSVSSPYATLSKALSAATAGSTIVLRGGTYRNQGGLSISKSVTIVAYPGETPIFNGATAVSGGWSVSGSLSYRSYTPIPVTTGSGINFSACQNQTASCMGQYPDQVWVGGTQLQQVASQAAVVAGTFYVDSTNDRLYLLTSDVDKGSVEVSNERTFANISAAHVTLRGFKIIRYSNTASDYGVIALQGTADNTLIDNIFMSDTAFLAMNAAPTGSTDANTGSTIQNSTIQYSNWMGVSLNSTTSFTFNHDIIGNMNQFNEFSSSPQSGSIKTSRTWYTKVLNSQFENDKTVALWFDQSNWQVTVAGNDIENNTGTGLFFEISDYLWAVNNYIKSNGANGIEISGSTDAYLVNNTLVGNYDPVGIYVDGRSQPGCSNPVNPDYTTCGSRSSDYDTLHSPHPATMTWIPTINLLLNNIIAYPAGTRYCSVLSDFCITNHNGTKATESINTVIHPANASLGVPQTLLDGNVYANGSNNIVWTGDLGSFSSLSAWSAALAGSPVNISGMEAHGLNGNQYVGTDGSPTSTLQSQMNNAATVPTDGNINPYVPAGTIHYGVLWK